MRPRPDPNPQSTVTAGTNIQIPSTAVEQKVEIHAHKCVPWESEVIKCGKSCRRSLSQFLSSDVFQDISMVFIVAPLATPNNPRIAFAFVVFFLRHAVTARGDHGQSRTYGEPAVRAVRQ